MADAQDLWGERARLRPRQVLFDAAVAACFTLVAGLVTAQQSPAMVCVTLALGLALLLRRLSWPAMAALAVLAGIVQLAAGQLAVLSDLGYAPLLFVLGAHPRAGVRRLGLAAAFAAALGLGLAVGTGRLDVVGNASMSFAVAASVAMALLVAGGGWSAGYARWQHRVRITAQVRTEMAQERSRIAADMHDLVAHTWAVVAAQADGARYSLAGPDGERRAAEALEVIAETARGSMADLRELLAELRYRQPAAPAGREALVARMRSSGMDLRMVRSGEPRTDSPRLLAEALTNALKHGDLAHPVLVEEDWCEGYRLSVRNRMGGGRPTVGAAFGAGTGMGAGHGLAGMRERVERAGGRLAAQAVGPDWVLTAEVPRG